MTREKARTFMRSLPQYPRREFKTLYPEAPAPALDLLEKLLHWDPAKRLSAAEALSHPYFDDIRDADFEQVGWVGGWVVVGGDGFVCLRQSTDTYTHKHNNTGAQHCD